MNNLFISYSHKDENLVEDFISHIAPLRNNGTLSEWIDRKIETGEEFQNDIDNNLENADIICLMISSNFLASDACLEEKDRALQLKEKRGIKVIPIIISPCSWIEDKELKLLLAVPTDGRPVTSFSNENDGWLDAVNWIKRACDSINLIKNLKLKTQFKEFLDSADILSKSHKNKEILNLEDIFVYPKLKCYDEEEVSHKYDSEKFNTEILKYEKLIIAGENQAGKTTLCKAIFQIYRELNFVPVFLDDGNKYLGNPHKKVEKAFLEQYEHESFDDIDTKRIVPIVDNFHLAKYQEKYIEQYELFKYQVLIVDDIFGLNIKNQALISEYSKFKIREFTSLERNELIRKWIEVKEESQIQINPNHLQQSIDDKTEKIENSLGIIFGKGIMPSHPFFILSILAAQDTQKPLDSEITSQGHCYQALIYLYLRKEGVTNEQIDIYTNFLTELSFWIFDKKNGFNLDRDDFEEFKKFYESKYNLPIPISKLIVKLTNVNICKFDCFNQYGFCYSYIYYFFVAKYLSEHESEEKEAIGKILSNLHKDENAYITVFIAHHTKSNYVLDKLLLNAEILFEKYEPATLKTDELSFFDKNEDKIVRAILPSYQHDPEAERKKLLIEKSEMEDRRNETETNGQADEDSMSSELLRDLRLSIKTVEVMGMIIKNRSGSLELKRLEDIFEQGLKVHLRILSSFIEIIKDEGTEQFIVNILKDRINQIIEANEDEKDLSVEKIEKLVKAIYWNLNFGVLHGFITKAIHALGSINLLKIADNVSQKELTPAAFIVNHGIKMWYDKNVKLKDMSDRISEQDFSKTAEHLIKFKVVEHCRMHKIDFKKLKEIEDILNLPMSKMLEERAKHK